MFVEEWEAVSIRVARVVVETDAYLAGSYPTTRGAIVSGYQFCVTIGESIIILWDEV
jgi:hypothetical protein